MADVGPPEAAVAAAAAAEGGTAAAAAAAAEAAGAEAGAGPSLLPVAPPVAAGLVPPPAEPAPSAIFQPVPPSLCQLPGSLSLYLSCYQVYLCSSLLWRGPDLWLPDIYPSFCPPRLLIARLDS